MYIEFQGRGMKLSLQIPNDKLTMASKPHTPFYYTSPKT